MACLAKWRIQSHSCPGMTKNSYYIGDVLGISLLNRRHIPESMAPFRNDSMISNFVDSTGGYVPKPSTALRP